MNLFGDMINKFDVNVNIMSFCKIDHQNSNHVHFELFRINVFVWNRHIGSRSIVIMINDRRKTYFKLIDPSHNDCVLFCIQLWHLLKLNLCSFCMEIDTSFYH